MNDSSEIHPLTNLFITGVFCIKRFQDFMCNARIKSSDVPKSCWDSLFSMWMKWSAAMINGHPLQEVVNPLTGSPFSGAPRSARPSDAFESGHRKKSKSFECFQDLRNFQVDGVEWQKERGFAGGAAYSCLDVHSDWVDSLQVIENTH